MIVLGLDSSLAHFGWAIRRIDRANPISGTPSLFLGRPSLFFGGVFTTKNQAGGKVGKGVDNSRRAQELYRQLVLLCREWRPEVMVVEGLIMQAGGRTTAGTISQLGRARGLADCLAVQFGCPLLEVSTMAIKRDVTGNLKASKEAVIKAMTERWGMDLSRVRPTLQEHAADAGGAIISKLAYLQARPSRELPENNKSETP